MSSTQLIIPDRVEIVLEISFLKDTTRNSRSTIVTVLMSSCELLLSILVFPSLFFTVRKVRVQTNILSVSHVKSGPSVMSLLVVIHLIRSNLFSTTTRLSLCYKYHHNCKKYNRIAALLRNYF